MSVIINIVNITVSSEVLSGNPLTITISFKANLESFIESLLQLIRVICVNRPTARVDCLRHKYRGDLKTDIQDPDFED